MSSSPRSVKKVENIMSRSYKRIPCCKDHNLGAKRLANKKVRRNNWSILAGNSYKKIFCSYSICDYKFLDSFLEYKNSHEKYNGKRYSDKELYKKWYKAYKMK